MSEWTLATLKEHFETLLLAHKEWDVTHHAAGMSAIQGTLDAAKEAVAKSEATTASGFAAVREAVNKAETATDKRFEAVNEFRTVLRDQQAGLLTKSEYTANHEALASRIALLEKTLSQMAGRTDGYSSAWGVMVAVSGIAIALLVVVLNHVWK